MPYAMHVHIRTLRQPALHCLTLCRWAMCACVRVRVHLHCTRGFLPDCVGLLTSQLYITTFEVLRARSAYLIPNPTARDLFAGVSASFASQTLMVPFEIVSQRQMVGGAKKHAMSAQVATVWVPNQVYHLPACFVPWNSFCVRRAPHCRPPCLLPCNRAPTLCQSGLFAAFHSDCPFLGALIATQTY